MSRRADGFSRRCISSIAALSSLACVVTTSTVQAQTLQDAFRSAIATNPDLAAQGERVTGLKAGVGAVAASRLPQISLSAGTSWLDRTDDAGRRGGTEVLEEWRSSLSVSQLLFDGFRTDNSVRQAQADFDRSGYELVLFRQSLLAEVAVAYATVRQARARDEAQHRLLDNIIAQREFVSRNLRAGMVTRTDLAQAEARLESAKAAVSRSRADVVAAEEQYRRLVGEAPGPLEPISTLTDLPETVDAAIDIARAKSPSLAASSVGVRAADFGLRASGFRPSA